MQTASEVSASTTDLEVNIASKADDVSAQSDCACDQCDDCTACNAPCATGCTATPVTLPPVLQTLSARGKRYDAFGVETLTAYPEDFIRPPGSLQS